MMFKGLILAVVFTFLFSCNKKEEEYKYYDDGSIKSINQIRNGVLDGTFKDYAPDGSIFRTGVAINGILEEVVYYYKNGNIREIEKYNADGKIIDLIVFTENGTRDSVATPFIYFLKGDTAVINEEVIMEIKILNAVDPIFNNSKLIITSGFNEFNGLLNLKDTLAMISPIEKFKFEYKFVPTTAGENIIHGQLIFQKEQDDKIKIITQGFSRSIFIKEK